MSSLPWHRAGQAAWEPVQGSGDKLLQVPALGSGTAQGLPFPCQAGVGQSPGSRVGSCTPAGGHCSLGELRSKSIPKPFGFGYLGLPSLQEGLGEGW